MRPVLLLVGLAMVLSAQRTPTINVPGFEVRTVASGLRNPTTMAFFGENDFLVLEKDSGRVLRFRERRRDEVLDLAVNNASERGLLGIALHPQFSTDRGVYLYWTCRTQAPHSTTDRAPETCDTSTSAMLEDDTDNILSVPLLGNRVDRFTWDGEKLTFDRNIILLRSLQVDGEPVPAGQSDAGQPPRGNHDAGVIAFGPDGKLYIYYGDQGRRGWLQNLMNGPPPGNGDDQFGGPEPDNAHLSGVILRLNPDGSTPSDNPFSRKARDAPGRPGRTFRKCSPTDSGMASA
jgi:aldose sugar dehydrogenase